MISKTFKALFIGIVLIIILFAISIFWPRSINAMSEIDAVLPTISENVPETKIHYIKSGEVTTLDAFTYSGGSVTKTKTLSHGAVLIEHPKGNILIDSGLGKNAKAQFEQDMPDFMKPLMEFEQLSDTKTEILKQNLPLPDKIILTHAHWDHASALEDFGDIQVMLTKEELDYVLNHGIPDIFPSQVENKEFTWESFEFSNTPYGIFNKSYDLYNDESIVIVPLHGHSPGSIGIFVNNKDKRRFFVGDAVWNKKAIAELKPKMWVSSMLTDGQRKEVENKISLLNAIQIQNPELIIVPSHDADAWE